VGNTLKIDELSFGGDLSDEFLQVYFRGNVARSESQSSTYHIERGIIKLTI